MKPHTILVRVCVALWWVSMTAQVAAQPAMELDVRLFHRVYAINAPGFARTMHAIDWSAIPVFGVGIASVGIGIIRDDNTSSAFYRLAASELLAAGLGFAVKSRVRRPRPYATHLSITPRAHVYWWDEFAFPSVHAAVAFAAVTSWTLSHPGFLTAASGYLWATGVALSRVWLGVHYPSDVFVGAILGTVVAIGLNAF